MTTMTNVYLWSHFQGAAIQGFSFKEALSVLDNMAELDIHKWRRVHQDMLMKSWLFAQNKLKNNSKDESALALIKRLERAATV